MSVVKLYKLTGALGNEARLEAALRGLRHRVRDSAGCLKIEIYRDGGGQNVLFFMEHWSSLSDQKAAGAALSGEVFAPLLEAVSEPPEMHTLWPIEGDDLGQP